MKWNCSLHYWPFVRWIHWWLEDSAVKVDLKSQHNIDQCKTQISGLHKIVGINLLFSYCVLIAAIAIASLLSKSILRYRTWSSPQMPYHRIRVPRSSPGRVMTTKLHMFHISHDDVIKWKHFPRYWPFVRGINRSPVNYPHKGQCCRALMFSLIYAWINDWVNNRYAGDLRRHRAHYDVIVMVSVAKWPH